MQSLYLSGSLTLILCRVIAPLDVSDVVKSLSNGMSTIYAEYLPDDVFQLEAIREHVHNMWPRSMPGHATGNFAIITVNEVTYTL